MQHPAAPPSPPTCTAESCTPFVDLGQGHWPCACALSTVHYGRLPKGCPAPVRALASGMQDERIRCAIEAMVSVLDAAYHPKVGVRLCSRNFQIDGAALGTAWPTFTQRLQFTLRQPKVMAELFKVRILRFFLRLKIGALLFQCHVLGLNKLQALAEDRRGAVLIDEFFDRFKWIQVHGVWVLRSVPHPS